MPKDISVLAGQRITAEAATWNGTPYSLAGSASVKGQGGDCSGSTYLIYQAAGFRYEYHTAGEFADYAADSGLFRELSAGEKKQDGDILSWSSHVAIYSTFSSATEGSFGKTQRLNSKGQPWTQVNDMWTAHHSGGSPYSSAALKYWGNSAPRVFRKLETP